MPGPQSQAHSVENTHSPTHIAPPPACWPFKCALWPQNHNRYDLKCVCDSHTLAHAHTPSSLLKISMQIAYKMFAQQFFERLLLKIKVIAFHFNTSEKQIHRDVFSIYNIYTYMYGIYIAFLCGILYDCQPLVSAADFGIQICLSLICICTNRYSHGHSCRYRYRCRYSMKLAVDFVSNRLHLLGQQMCWQSNCYLVHQIIG